MAEVLEKSLKDKMEEAYCLSIRLVYNRNPEGRLLEVRQLDHLPSEQSDEIWSWVDGLWHKYAHKHMDGRCSLQATVDFDIAKFEEMVDQHIAMMCEVAKQENIDITNCLAPIPEED